MMGYEIALIEENRIVLRHGLRDELNGFIVLLKSIESDLDGRIIQMDGDEIQYSIQKDPYNLVYKWDAQLGMVVVVPNMEDMDSVVTMLKSNFDKLNN